MFRWLFMRDLEIDLKCNPESLQCQEEDKIICNGTKIVNENILRG